MEFCQSGNVGTLRPDYAQNDRHKDEFYRSYDQNSLKCKEQTHEMEIALTHIVADDPRHIWFS